MVVSWLTRVEKQLCSPYTAGAALMMASVSNGMFTGWATVMLPILMSVNHLHTMNEEQISWVMSMHFLGEIISPIPAGVLMDNFGRKSILVCSGFTLPPVSWLLLIFSGDRWQLLSIARILSGVWHGIVNTISPMYMAEIAQPHQRGQLNTLNYLSFRLGNLFTVIVALLVPCSVFPVILSLTTVLFLILCPFIPESPYFYIKRNNRIAARQALSWLRSDKTENDIDAELTQLEVAVKKQTENQGTFLEAISNSGNVRALLIVEILTILLRLAGIGAILSYLTISLPVIQNLSPTVYIIIIDSVRLASGFMSSMIIDKVGYKILLITTSTICAVMMTMTSFWYYLNRLSSTTRSNSTIHEGTSSAVETLATYVTQELWWAPFACITLHGIFFALGVTPVCLNIRSEYFPINIKGKCSALTSAVSALTSFALSKTYLVTGSHFGLYFNFGIYAVGNILITVVGSLFLVETKGKTLQQIQDELHNSEPKNN